MLPRLGLIADIHVYLRTTLLHYRVDSLISQLNERTFSDQHGKVSYVIRRLKIIGWNRLTKTLQMLLRIFPPKNISVKYLQEPGFLLFTELFLQNVPQPVHYSVVAMVTTVISCVTSVGRKTNKLAKMQWYNKMNVWARYPWRHQTEDCKIIPRMYRMHTT